MNIPTKLLAMPKALVLVVLALLLSACDQSEPKAIDMKILHINDHHSHIEEDDFDFDVSNLNLVTKNAANQAISEVEVTYGGFPMLVELFNTEAAKSNNVLKLHAGDAMTGTLFYTLFEGKADADMMNQVCFDAFALGNHEFDQGDAGLAKFLNFLKSGTCSTPVLAANVVPAADSAIASDFIQPYVIKEIEGEKVGIIGIDIAGKTKNSSNPDEGTIFKDETTTAQNYIDKLTLLGVNKIILLTHYTYENDIQLAANLSGVDIIVGGDSHSFLGSDNFKALGFNPVGQYPTKVTNMDGEEVCIVQAWEYAYVMGSLDVSFDDKGVVTNCSGNAIMPIKESFVYEVDDDNNAVLSGADSDAVRDALTQYAEVVVVTPDASTEALMSNFKTEVSELEQKVIGQVATDLCLDRFPGQGRSKICDSSDTSQMGSDISNIVAKAFMDVTPTADIAIQNGGGVRVDVSAGDYTIADAYTLLPFSNTLVSLNMTGQQIIDVLEDALANALDNGGSSGSYPYASGLRYDVDASQAKGSRISNVQVNPRVAGAWADIDKTKLYTVVTNNFIAKGRDGYTTFGTLFDEGKFVDTFTEYAQGFIDYVEKLTAAGQSLQKLPSEEYSTQTYIGRDGCNHSTSNCTGY